MAIIDTSPASTWGSRWTFSLALAATVLGLGNLWQVPPAMVAHGGGAFLLVYVLVLFFAGVPVVMAELSLARRCHTSPIPALRRISQGSALAPWMPWVGRSMVLAACLLLGLYAVVGGIALAYLFAAALGDLAGHSPGASLAFFTDFHGNRGGVLFWQLVFMLLVIAVSIRPLQQGLQRSLRTLMPLLALIIVVMAVVGAISGKAGEASWALFSFRWQDLGWEGILKAASMAFFSLAIGTGALMTLGAYMPGNASVPVSAIGVAVADLVVTLLVGLAVVSMLFAHQVASVSGFELIFVALPQIFDVMPAGQLVGSLFYIMLVLLAWTSALFVMEVIVARVTEMLGGLRFPATLVAAVPACLSGALAAWGFSGESGIDFFSWMSHLAALLFIPVGVLGIVLLAGRSLPPLRVVSFLGLTGTAFRLWRQLLGVLVPLIVLIVVGSGAYERFRVLCVENPSGWCGHGDGQQLQEIGPVSEEPIGGSMNDGGNP